MQTVALSANGKLMAYGRYDATLVMTRRGGASVFGFSLASAMRR